MVDDIAVIQQEASEQRRGRTKRGEHPHETSNEERRADEGGAKTRAVSALRGETGDEPKVAGKERKATRRGESEYPRGEGEGRPRIQCQPPDARLGRLARRLVCVLACGGMGAVGRPASLAAIPGAAL